MDDLVQWLRAQLDEDHAALLRYRDGHEGPCINYAGQDPADYDDHDSCVLHLEAAKTTPYRDADFGLREIDAKRRIMAMYEEAKAAVDTYTEPSNRLIAAASRNSLASAVKALAVPYSDRPGYRDDWRP